MLSTHAVVICLDFCHWAFIIFTFLRVTFQAIRCKVALEEKVKKHCMSSIHIANQDDYYSSNITI